MPEFTHTWGLAGPPQSGLMGGGRKVEGRLPTTTFLLLTRHTLGGQTQNPSLCPGQPSGQGLEAHTKAADLWGQRAEGPRIRS